MFNSINVSMLTMYWTVELDLRFYPQANGGTDGGMDGEAEHEVRVGGGDKQPEIECECGGRTSHDLLPI